MRYNPETERGLTLEAIAQQCRQAILRAPSVHRPQAPVWNCQTGGWQPAPTAQNV